jgi:uncharacterized protein (TIGR00661 family)
MKILWGIQLNGNGHLTRSIEVINKLRSRGHLVDIITSGENCNLDLGIEHKHFKGLDLFLDDYGSISWMKTLRRANIYRLVKDTNLDVSEYDLVISDFEPISAWSSIRSGVRSIGISNQYSLLSQSVSNTKDFIYREFVRVFAPCDDYIGLNYLKDEDYMSYPIISDKLFKKMKSNNSILVYLPNYDINKQIEIFNKFQDFNFIVYSKNIIDCENNIKIKLHNRDEFILDMIKCHSVITASGFTTTTESLVLGKKLWSIPMKNHYEQLSNSKKLIDMGVFTDNLSVENFRIWIEDYKKIEYDWEDPIDEIIKKIENYGKN